MIWIDYAITGLVSIALIVGGIRGVSVQAYALLCELIALCVGLGFSREFSFFLPASIHDPAARLALAFIALYLITVLLGSIIRLLLGALIKNTELTLLERFGGAVIGLLNGAIWATAIIILAGLSVLPNSPWWPQATLIPPFQTIALWLQHHIPSDLLDTIHYR